MGIDFFFSKGGTISFLEESTFSFLEEKKQKTLRERMPFGEKTLSRTSYLEHKNGRFVCEPSVLCNTLTKAAKAQRSNCSADDFLLHGRFARESWRAGAADTGRDKAEEGGIPAVVFRPTTTQDVPASVRLRGCASRAYRPFFLSRKKRKGVSSLPQSLSDMPSTVWQKRTCR